MSDPTIRKSDTPIWGFVMWPLLIVFAIGIGYWLLVFVGETVEHFTP